MIYLAGALTFAIAYAVNVGTITVFYHRALAHRALALRPAVLRLVVAAGPWLTGLDPKGWVCMHRLHHACSDTEKDPHSPRHVGLFGVLLAQLRSYQRTLYGLLTEHPSCARMVHDLDFPVHWLNRRGLWWLPYLVHAALALLLALAAGWPVGLGYYAGLMSHPLEGWAVNGLGHAVGGRNFETDDDSRNNWLVALLVCGEGLQNNHHRHPSSARFSVRWWEPDLGYAMCLVMQALGLVTIDRSRLSTERPDIDRPS